MRRIKKTELLLLLLPVMVLAGFALILHYRDSTATPDYLKRHMVGPWREANGLGVLQIGKDGNGSVTYSNGKKAAVNLQFIGYNQVRVNGTHLPKAGTTVVMNIKGDEMTMTTTNNGTPSSHVEKYTRVK